MFREAIEFLMKSGKAEIITVDKRQYSTQQLHLLSKKKPEPIIISTLDGIVALASDLLENEDAMNLVLQIKAYNEVRLLGHIDSVDAVRPCYAIAKFEPVPWKEMGHMHEIEEAIILLQSQFVQDPERGRVLDFLSNVESVASLEVTDNGTSQSAVVRTGIASKANATFVSPANLCPYRTFPEIEQPPTPFYMRLEKSMEVRFIAADGGAWETEAKKRIKKYLTEKELDSVLIIG